LGLGARHDDEHRDGNCERSHSDSLLAGSRSPFQVPGSGIAKVRAKVPLAKNLLKFERDGLSNGVVWVEGP
jgi:hypothetical protein